MSDTGSGPIGQNLLQEDQSSEGSSESETEVEQPSLAVKTQENSRKLSEQFLG